MSKCGLRLLDYGLTGWDIDLNKNFEILERMMSSRIVMIAAAALSAKRAVYITSAGQVNLALADGTQQPCVGMTLAAHASGAEGIIVIRGLLESASTGMTAGGLVYLSGSTAGRITQTPPASNVQKLGIAINETDIWLFGNLLVS